MSDRSSCDRGASQFNNPEIYKLDDESDPNQIPKLQEAIKKYGDPSFNLDERQLRALHCALLIIKAHPDDEELCHEHTRTVYNLFSGHPPIRLLQFFNSLFQDRTVFNIPVLQ